MKKKIIAIFLLLAFFISSLKLSDFQKHREHFICENSDSLHFHKLPALCDFCKIVFNDNYHFSLSKTTFLESGFNNNTYFVKYFFLNTFEELPFSLRAPPTKI